MKAYCYFKETCQNSLPGGEMSVGKDMGSSVCSSKCLGVSIRKFNSVPGNKRENTVSH